MRAVRGASESGSAIPGKNFEIARRMVWDRVGKSAVVVGCETGDYERGTDSCSGPWRNVI